MKRPPNCGCGCNCNVIWTPSDNSINSPWDNINRSQLPQGCALQFDSNPFMDLLDKPFAIPLDGLPAAPLPLAGGPLDFGYSEVPGDNGGLGVFNLNSNAIRFHRYCTWPDIALDQVEPFSTAIRAAKEYPATNPVPLKPFEFTASDAPPCTWSESLGFELQEETYSVGTEAEDEQVVISYDNCLFRPQDFMCDAVRLYKWLFPISYNYDIDGNIVSVKTTKWEGFAVFFNYAIGDEVRPIKSVPRDPCIWSVNSPPYTRFPLTFNVSIEEAVNGVPYTSGYGAGNGGNYDDVFTRINIMPGQAELPYITYGTLDQGREITERLVISSKADFVDGTWTVEPAVSFTIEMQHINYHTVILPSSNIFTGTHPSEVFTVGSTPSYPYASSPRVGWPDGFYAGVPFDWNIIEEPAPLADDVSASWNAFVNSFFTTDPTQGHYIIILRIHHHNPALDPSGLQIHIDTLPPGDPYNHWSGQIPPPFRFTQGQQYHLPGQTALSEDFPDWGDTPSFLQSNKPLQSWRGQFYLPAFLGTVDATFQFVAHNNVFKTTDKYRDVGSLSVQTRVPGTFTTEYLAGYMGTVASSEYRDPDDPVYVDLEPVEYTLEENTWLSDYVSVFGDYSVFSLLQGLGGPPIYTGHVAYRGPVSVECHAIPGAVMVRDVI